MAWMLRPYRRYADFSGRAPRVEYWSFVLLMALVYAFYAVFFVFGAEYVGFEWASHRDLMKMVVVPAFILLGIFNVLSIIPGLAVTVRRLHDTGRSGWAVLWALVPIIGALMLLAFYATPGTDGENQFWPDPLRQD